jgi:predicted ATPase/DNA-binding CsgD family transcriptional regulator
VVTTQQAGALPSTLPLPPTSFVGRERAVEGVRRLLGSSRLVTLSGPPGVGKTRLALEVAAGLEASRPVVFPDGIVFISLDALRDARLVLPTIAQALGVQQSAALPVAQALTRHLVSRHLLLVLDSIEPVVEAGPQLVELLTACPRLHLLVTSRAFLRLSGEHIFEVPPLGLPEARLAGEAGAIEALTRAEAGRLFVQRAQAVRPDFVVTEAVAGVVSEICRRLDGLPLAIELAAARVPLLPPQALLARLERRLSLLTGGARDLPPRHQTLRAALAWSHDLLSPTQQALFRRLAVFAGGFTLEAAEAVATLPGQPHLDVLEELAALVDRSLVQPVPPVPPVRSEAAAEDGVTDHPPRMRLLGTIREYALERLVEAGESEVVQRRHATYYLGLAEQAEPGLEGAAWQPLRSRLAADYENLRAALRWTIDGGEAVLALRLAGALWRYWLLQDQFGEGRDWLAAALATGAGAGAEASQDAIRARIKALYGAASLAGAFRQLALARALAEECLALTRRVDDRRTMAGVLSILAVSSMRQNDNAVARQYGEEALALERQAGNRRGMVDVASLLVQIHCFDGHRETARSLLEDALASARMLEDRQALATALLRLASVASDLEDDERLQALCQEGLAIARELGDHLTEVYALRVLAWVARYRLDFTAARRWYEAALALERELGHETGISSALHSLAELAFQEGDDARARALCEEALPIALRGGDWGPYSEMLIILARMAIEQGRGAAARAYSAEARALRRQQGPRAGVASALHRLAEALDLEGERAHAGALHAEAMALRRDVGHLEGLASSLDAIGGHAARWGQAERAVRLLAAATTLRRSGALRLQPASQRERDAFLALAQGQLEAAAYRAAWAEGQAMGPEDAIAYALAAGDEVEIVATPPAGSGPLLPQTTSAPPPPVPQARSVPADAVAEGSPAERRAVPGGLTAREVEVLCLLAAGKSNREIADELVVSARTVERHLANIYGKLDVRGRVEAAAFALRHGLASGDASPTANR